MSELSFLEQQIFELPADEYRIAGINDMALKALPPKGDILDFGAGAGHLIESILKHPKKNDVTSITGLDISPILIEYIKKQYKKEKKVKVLDGLEKTPEEATYDRIYTLDVLEHIEDDVDYMKMLRKSLKEGGKALINVPAHQSLYSKFDKDLGHHRRYSKKELAEKCKKAGFSNVEVRYWNTLGYSIVRTTTVIPFLKRPTSVRTRTTKKQELLNSALRWWFINIENTIPSPKGLSLIAIVTK